uniref:Uncharacterized protein n=1 Tax=Cacopsylla melanoneura TaxID=428564 RepID=A0A8D9ED13_9HEMI
MSLFKLNLRTLKLFSNPSFHFSSPFHFPVLILCILSLYPILVLCSPHSELHLHSKRVPPHAYFHLHSMYSFLVLRLSVFLLVVFNHITLCFICLLGLTKININILSFTL